MKAKLKIKNFRILQDVEIDLRNTTFILGPNGSGKSTFLKALLFLSRHLSKSKSVETQNNIDDQFSIIYNPSDTTEKIEKTSIYRHPIKFTEESIEKIIEYISELLKEAEKNNDKIAILIYKMLISAFKWRKEYQMPDISEYNHKELKKIHAIFSDVLNTFKIIVENNTSEKSFYEGDVINFFNYDDSKELKIKNGTDKFFQVLVTDLNITTKKTIRGDESNTQKKDKNGLSITGIASLKPIYNYFYSVLKDTVEPKKKVILDRPLKQKKNLSENLLVRKEIDESLSFQKLGNITTDQIKNQKIEFEFEYFGELPPLSENDLRKIETYLQKYNLNEKDVTEIQNTLSFTFKTTFNQKNFDKKLRINFGDYNIQIKDNIQIKKEINEYLKNNSIKKDEFSYFNIFANIRSNKKSKLAIEEELYKYIITKTGQYIYGCYNDDIDIFKTIIENRADEIIQWLKTKKEWKSLKNKKKRELFLNGLFLYYHREINIPTFIYNYLIIDVNNYFKTIREIPKRKYVLQNNSFLPNDYYNSLELLPIKSQVNDIINKALKLKETSFRQSFLKFNSRIIETKEQINEQINEQIFITLIVQRLGFGKIIFTEKHDNHGYIKLLTNNDKIIDLIDASSGLLQTLPFFIKCVQAYDILYIITGGKKKISIEQPELHLHPKLQVKLTEIFIELAKGNSFLIETHSEHIIRKLQIMFAKGEITDDDVIINYFDNIGGTTKVKKMEMDEYGFFKNPWPDGFFDESYDLTEELLMATKKN